MFGIIILVLFAMFVFAAIGAFIADFIFPRIKFIDRYITNIVENNRD